MRRQTLVLLGLFLGICGWMLWARLPATQPVTASEPSTSTQTSPQPTPLPPMSTPVMTRQVEADWQTYSSPYWGVSFRYPPDWELHSPESRLAQIEYPTTEQQRYRSAVASPLALAPPEGKLGAIHIALNANTISTESTLADWVLIYNEWSGRNGLWGFSPLELATIPAAALPAGIDDGVYSVNDRPYNPARVMWLQRGEFVYSLSSTFNRPEDIALIFAIMQTFEFDPAVEATLRASGNFRRDDEMLRQELAKMDAEVAERCDATCEYIREMEERERWKTLPAAERPLVQPIRPIATDAFSQTYTQPLLGLSFRYEPGLEVIDPFAEKNLDESSLFDEAISIIGGSTLGGEVMKIELFPYTVSDDVPLNNWEAIQDQLDRARNPLNRYQYRLLVPIEWGYAAQHVDDMVHTQDQAPYYRIETFWLSKDGVVFKVTSSYPYLAPNALGIVSTMEFDTARLEELRALGLFAGDERTMVDELVQEWANPQPTVDPGATATPIPTPTLRPSPTRTPTIRNTVTPSAFESPLVNGLRQYHGRAADEAHTPYRLLFDAESWQWLVDEQGTDYLGHQHLIGCELWPGRRGWEIPILAPVELAGQEWAIYYASSGDDVAEVLIYAVGWDGGYFQATLFLSEPLPSPYDPQHKSHCQRDAEAVLDSFTYEAMSPTPTATPTPIPTLSPTVRATVTPSASESPLVDGLQRYQSQSFNERQPPFELWFDPQTWQLAADAQGDNYLVHQTIAQCEITLQAYLIYHVALPPVTLAGVEWRVSYPTDTEREYLAYTREWEDEDNEYTFFVALPTPVPTIYDPDDKSQCELDAEVVIGTHTVIETTPTAVTTPPPYGATLPTVTPTPNKK